MEKVRKTSTKIDPCLEEPAPVKSLALLPWIIDSGDAAVDAFLGKAEVLQYAAGTTIQMTHDKYEGVYVVAQGIILVMGQAGLIRLVFL